MRRHRFGRLAPRHDPRTLRFSTYTAAALAPPPASLNTLDRVYHALGESDATKLFPMDGNNQFGDCTIAALAHAVTTYRGLVGQRRIMTERTVLSLYFKLTGGPDAGLVELDVLNYWHRHSEGGDKILAYVAVDPKRHVHVQRAIEWFGGIYLGFQVPGYCMAQFDAGVPWTPGPLTGEGHAVFVVGYDADGVTVLTWGRTQRGTWAWWDACVDEAYAILPPEAHHPNFAPGFNFTQLEADLAALKDITVSAGI